MATLAVDMELSVESTFEDAYDGVRTFLLLDQLIDNYAWDQASDVEWATDWSDRDDAYSKSVTMDFEQSYGINTNCDGGTPTFVMGKRGRGPGGLSPGQVRNRVKGLRPSRRQVGGHMSIPGREGVRVYVARSPAEASRKIRMGRERDVYVRNQQDAETVIAGLPRMQKAARFVDGPARKRDQYEYHGPDMGAVDMHHIKYRTQRDDGTDVDGHIFWGSALESKPRKRWGPER